MRDHIAYGCYVLRHKLFVFRACREVGVPLLQALLHDWSKFLPSEWVPYVHCFYRPDGSKHYKESPAFNYAWNAHQKRQPHHWQYWLLTMDRGEEIPLVMPERFAREMVADWIGAGLAITGKRETREWYRKHKGNMRLHPATRAFVEELLEEHCDD